MDNDILNLFLVDKKSILLENIVAIHLYQKYRDNLYYLKGKNSDIDFFVKDKQLAIQVAYTLNEDSFAKERQSIVNFAKTSKEKSEFVIVTYEQEKELSIGGISVKVIPLNKFLLNY